MWQSDSLHPLSVHFFEGMIVRSTLFVMLNLHTKQNIRQWKKEYVLILKMQYMHSFALYELRWKYSCQNIKKKKDQFLCKILFINDLKRASDCFSDNLEIQNFPGEAPPPPPRYPTNERDQSPSRVATGQGKVGEI